MKERLVDIIIVAGELLLCVAVGLFLILNPVVKKVSEEPPVDITPTPTAPAVPTITPTPPVSSPETSTSGERRLTKSLPASQQNPDGTPSPAPAQDDELQAPVPTPMPDDSSRVPVATPTPDDSSRVPVARPTPDSPRAPISTSALSSTSGLSQGSSDKNARTITPAGFNITLSDWNSGNVGRGTWSRVCCWKYPGVWCCQWLPDWGQATGGYPYNSSMSFSWGVTGCENVPFPGYSYGIHANMMSHDSSYFLHTCGNPFQLRWR